MLWRGPPPALGMGRLGRTLKAQYPRALLPLLLLGAACSEAPAELGEQHPSSRGYLHPIPPAGVLRLGADSADARSSDMPTIGVLEVALEIGALDTPAEHVFGRIVDALERPRGDLFVLDALARAVRVFDRTGRSTQTLGGYGHGPGEFVEPKALWEGPHERIYVGDARGKISAFSAENDTLQLHHTFRFDGTFWDACFMNDVLYVHGLRPGDPNTVHTYTVSGERRGGFGEVYSSSNRIINLQLSEGRIACIEEAGRVLLAPSMLPEIRAYSASGELAWWLTIDGYTPMRVWEAPNAGSRLRIPDETWHMSAGVVEAGAEGSVVFQVARYTGGAGGENKFAGVESYLISAREGSAVSLGSGWPRILHWRRGRIMAMVPDPYPQIIVYDTANFWRLDLVETALLPE